MKAIVIFLIVNMYVPNSFSQCTIPYVKTNFNKIEYYTAENSKLKLIEATYSTNTFEIFKSTLNGIKSYFSIVGDFGKYVVTITQFNCTKEANFTNYKIYTNDGQKDEIWLVTILNNNVIFKVTNIRVADNLLIEFVNR